MFKKIIIAWMYFVFLAASLGIWRLFILGGSFVLQGTFYPLPSLLSPTQSAFAIGFTAFLISGFLLFMSIKKLEKFLILKSKIIHYYVVINLISVLLALTVFGILITIAVKLFLVPILGVKTYHELFTRLSTLTDVELNKNRLF